MIKEEIELEREKNLIEDIFDFFLYYENDGKMIRKEELEKYKRKQ